MSINALVNDDAVVQHAGDHAISPTKRECRLQINQQIVCIHPCVSGASPVWMSSNA